MAMEDLKLQIISEKMLSDSFLKMSTSPKHLKSMMFS